MESTPHSQDPAEGARGVDRSTENEGHEGGDDGAIQGDADRGESTGGAIQGDAGSDREDSGDGEGGAIQGDASRGESKGGAIQGSAGPEHDAPLGGDKTTEDQLTADNQAEEDMLKSLDPDAAPA